MTRLSTYLTTTLFVATCLALGCGDDAGGPTIDSTLLGVYQIDTYQASADSCEGLADVNSGADFLVLYPFRPNDDPEEARMGGVFCFDVADCRGVAAAAPDPVVGYSFSTGDDQSGWLGWGIQNSRLLNDQCEVDVQAHTLTSTAATIDIQTKTLQTVYSARPEDIDGNEITCRIADAINSLNDDLPCIGAFSLQATFEAGL